MHDVSLKLAISAGIARFAGLREAGALFPTPVITHDRRIESSPKKLIVERGPVMLLKTLSLKTLLLTFGALIVATGLAVADEGRSEAQSARGYLPAGSFDILKVLPPAPLKDSPAAVADRQIYLDTRGLKGSPRWALAVADDDYAPKSLIGNFSCAVGVELEPKALPKLMSVYSKLGPDLIQAFEVAKTHYATKRPSLLYGGEICLPTSAGLDNSPDYPSGHAALGWTLGLIMAEVAPDRAQDVLIRGRVFAESRAVCGVHTASAVAGGQTVASTLVAALHGQAAFRADLDAARAEMELYRKTAPKPVADCLALKTLVETPAY